MSAQSVQGRLQKMQRGWFLDKAPRFHDVKNKFLEASKRNGTVKMAALAEALAKFGLFNGSPDAVQALTKQIRNDDFGYTNRTTAARGRKREPSSVYGPPSSIVSMSAGTRAGVGTGERFGGV